MATENGLDVSAPKRAKPPSAKAATHVEAIVGNHPVLLSASVCEYPFDEEARRNMISELAYLRAAKRGFKPGKELDDWLAAEIEVNSRLLGTA